MQLLLVTCRCRRVSHALQRCCRQVRGPGLAPLVTQQTQQGLLLGFWAGLAWCLLLLVLVACRTCLLACTAAGMAVPHRVEHK